MQSTWNWSATVSPAATEDSWSVQSAFGDISYCWLSGSLLYHCCCVCGCPVPASWMCPSIFSPDILSWLYPEQSQRCERLFIPILWGTRGLSSQIRTLSSSAEPVHRRGRRGAGPVPITSPLRIRDPPFPLRPTNRKQAAWPRPRRKLRLAASRTLCIRATSRLRSQVSRPFQCRVAQCRSNVCRRGGYGAFDDVALRFAERSGARDGRGDGGGAEEDEDGAAARRGASARGDGSTRRHPRLDTTCTNARRDTDRISTCAVADANSDLADASAERQTACIDVNADGVDGKKTPDTSGLQRRSRISRGPKTNLDVRRRKPDQTRDVGFSCIPE